MEWPWTFPLTFSWIVLAQLALGIPLGLSIALRKGPIGLLRASLCSIAIAFVAIASAVATRFLVSPSFFGVLTHAFAALLSVCISGASVILFARRRSRPWAKAAAALAAAGLPVLAWACFVEPYALERIEVEVPLHVLRRGSEPIRVGVLSDLQTTRVASHEHAAVDLLLAEKPDIILLPGDLYQGPPERWEGVRDGFRELLQRLVAPGGVYLVPGDCDTNARLGDLVLGTPVQLLIGESELIRVRDRRVRLFGADLRRPAQSQLDAFARAGAASGDDVRILLAHRPEIAMVVPLDAPLDLVVAGHTHGGQVRLPGGIALVDLSPVPNRVGGGGLHYLGHQLLYVSRGVGMERSLAPRLRLGCRPEVSLLVLQ